MDLRSMEVRTFPADAIIVCTGGNGAIFGKSTNSVVCTGSAQSALYQQGAFYANGEFIQVHPTAIPGEDKLRLMSESARGEGGRVWVPRDKLDKRAAQSIPESDRWYFLEERYPKYGNLVPRDIATREIFKVVYERQAWASTASRWSTSTSRTLARRSCTSSKASSRSTRSSSATTRARSR